MTDGLGAEEHDQEGRVITAEYPGFYGADCNSALWTPKSSSANTQRVVPCESG